MRKGLGSGWHFESARHALASRGIKSGTRVKATLPIGKPTPRETSRTTFDLMMDFEGGNLTKAEFLTLFSRLIRNGQAWSLQGFYGRQAQALIDAGLIDRSGKINWSTAGNTREMLYEEDSDGDGVPDSDDCSPRDPTRQDYALQPNDSHKSFYGKAMVRRENGRLILRSYDTDVAYIENGRAVVRGRYSNTTARHIRAFLIENNIPFNDMNDALRRYPENPEPPRPEPTPTPRPIQPEPERKPTSTSTRPPENWWE
jgi:hypothetical protein